MSAPLPRRSDVGLVAIGRNEGERMLMCIRSALREIADASAVVYVDSGSTDGSAEKARQLGATVVELDMSVPFTAARARNAGLEALLERHPLVRYVQFVDADCEVVAGWLATAVEALREDPKLAGVAGRRRERYPEATPYNKLCDLEWNTPVGEARAVGGDALFRVEALREVEGYDPGLIAGEEPEMCVRLRERGWKLRRLDAEMTLHDAAMTSARQWWKRSARCGHAQIEVYLKHRSSPCRIWGRESLSTAVWAVGPVAMAVVATVALALSTSGWWWLLGLLPLLLYDLLFLRVLLRGMRAGHDFTTAALNAASVTMAKFPQFAGQLRYLANRLTGRRATLIEYKGPAEHAR